MSERLKNDTTHYRTSFQRKCCNRALLLQGPILFMLLDGEVGTCIPIYLSGHALLRPSEGFLIAQLP